MYQADPLSASMIPYFFIARRMTWTSGGYGVMSKLAFKRSRSPMRGYWDPVRLDDQSRHDGQAGGIGRRPGFGPQRVRFEIENGAGIGGPARGLRMCVKELVQN